MSKGERYQIRARISMLYREANLFEDRQTEAGRVKASELRREARQLTADITPQEKNPQRRTIWAQ
jgi:hypothetical protein